MSWKNTPERYGALSIKMHWLMVILMVAVYASIELRVFFEKGTDMRDAFKMWHFMLGLLTLALVLVRIYLRFTQVTPAIKPTPSSHVMISAKLAHLALYALMIIMPMMGWMILSAAGKPIPFFGLELPALTSTIDKDFSHEIEEIHELIGTIGYYLIGLHAAAAIFHHHFIKDDTLTRMLPKK